MDQLVLPCPGRSMVPEARDETNVNVVFLEKLTYLNYKIISKSPVFLTFIISDQHGYAFSQE